MAGPPDAGGAAILNPPTQYATGTNLAARQRLWAESTREPPFDLIDWVLDLAGLGDGSTASVLDIGCGNGRYEERLAQRGHRGTCTALDLSAGMLREVPAGRRVQADAEQLPVASGAVDVVLAPHMLYHVPDVALAAQEAARVLRPAGALVAVTNGRGNLAGLTRLIEEAVGGGWRMRRPADEHFSLEHGADLLAPAFADVVRVACPPGEVVVTDVDAVADYVASTADHYQDQVDLPWATVVERTRAACASMIAEHGALRLATSVGAFVCR